VKVPVLRITVMGEDLYFSDGDQTFDCAGEPGIAGILLTFSDFTSLALKKIV
jgi:hypothetical protein